MTRTHQRILSWLSTLGASAAIAIGWTAVPGAAGPADELRWILTHANFNQRGHKSAAQILQAAPHNEEDAAALYAELLVDQNPRIAGHALTLLADRLELWRPTPGDPQHGTWRDVFATWLRHTAPATKLTQRVAALRCVQGLFADDLPRAWDALPLDAGDVRWLLAGTLERSLHVRLTALDVIFGPARSDNPLRERFLYAGQVRTRLRPHANVDRLPTADIARAWSKYIRVSRETLLSLLNDPDQRVRWAAGRVLAIAGDARGLPAFGDWLRKAHRRRNTPANLLMTALYGAEWHALAGLEGSSVESP